MKALTPIQRRERKPYRHKKSEGYRQVVRRKPEAFHRFVQWGCIAQGLLQYLSLGRGEEVWRHVRCWMRTRRTGNPPPERVVASALRSSLGNFRRMRWKTINSRKSSTKTGRGRISKTTPWQHKRGNVCECS